MFAHGFKKVGGKDQQGRSSKDRPHPGFSEKERVMTEAKQRAKDDSFEHLLVPGLQRDDGIHKFCKNLSGSEIHRIANGATAG